MSHYHVTLTSQGNYENPNVHQLNKSGQQMFKNPQQSFSVECVPSLTPQHSMEDVSPKSRHNLPWNYSRGTSNPDSFRHQNMSFVRPKSQGEPCTDSTFHFDSGLNPKSFLSPLAPFHMPPPLPPPPPPPLLPLGKNSRPSLSYTPRPSYLHTDSLQCSGSPRFPINRFEPPSPNIFDGQNQEFKNRHRRDTEIEERDSISSLQRASVAKLSLNSLKEEQDREWLRSWLVKLRERHWRKGKTSNIKISDIQRKLLKYASLVKELEDILEQFSCEELEDQNLEKLYQKSEHLKHEISLLQNFFGVEKNITEIKELLAYRRDKRLKKREVKKVKAERRRKLKEEWKEKEKKIDQQLKQIYEGEKTKVIEEKVKKEADIILREVRTKQEEVYRMQKLLEALSQLREARIKKGEVHGYITSPQANAFFVKLQDEFRELLPSQLDLYQGEEQTLKVMMEESRSTLSHSSGKALNSKIPNADKLQKLTYEILFGKKISRGQCNEFQRSFTASEESVEILINRRHDWDQFLVDVDSPIGSSIPVGWVVPNIKPNSDWRCFQQDITK